MSSNTLYRTLPLDDEFVCWDGGNHGVFLANETGAVVVQGHCQGWSEHAIVRALAERNGLATHEVSRMWLLSFARWRQIARPFRIPNVDWLTPARYLSGVVVMLAARLALQGCTFWGDDLIVLRANARDVVPSVAWTSVKTGSQSVVFGSELERGESRSNNGGLGCEGLHENDDTLLISGLIENPLAQAGGWIEQFMMLKQLRAPAQELLTMPGCFLFPQFDEQCETIEMTPLGSVDAFRRIRSAGLATILRRRLEGWRRCAACLAVAEKFRFDMGPLRTFGSF